GYPRRLMRACMSLLSFAVFPPSNDATRAHMTHLLWDLLAAKRERDRRGRYTSVAQGAPIHSWAQHANTPLGGCGRGLRRCPPASVAAAVLRNQYAGASGSPGAPGSRRATCLALERSALRHCGRCASVELAPSVRLARSANAPSGVSADRRCAAATAGPRLEPPWCPSQRIDP